MYVKVDQKLLFLAKQPTSVHSPLLLLTPADSCCSSNNNRVNHINIIMATMRRRDSNKDITEEASPKEEHSPKIEKPKAIDIPRKVPGSSSSSSPDGNVPQKLVVKVSLIVIAAETCSIITVAVVILSR